jgi:hypothetical protein
MTLSFPVLWNAIKEILDQCFIPGTVFSIKVLYMYIIQV